jgi:hypothetical protein
MADEYSFGIGDLLSKIRSEGLPANARAYLETVASHVSDSPNPKFGNEYFSEKQLELLRKAVENRTSDSVNSDESLRDVPGATYKLYKGPLAKKLGIGSLLQTIYNDKSVIETSLGNFLVKEDDKNYYISDPFDFAGRPNTLLESVKQASDETPSEFAYAALRNWASRISPERQPVDKPPPVFELTIPKEGPIPREPEKRARGGFIDKPLYDRDPYG